MSMARPPVFLIVSFYRRTISRSAPNFGTLVVLDILMLALIFLAVLVPAAYAAFCRRI